MKTVSYTGSLYNADRRLILFGGSIYGELVTRVIQELYHGKVYAIVDNKIKKLPWTDIPVFRTSNLYQVHNADIIICAAGSFENICNEVAEIVDSSCRVFDAIELLEDFKKSVLSGKLQSDNHYVYGTINLDDLIDKYNYYAGVENGYDQKLFLPYCVLCITTKCSLRCKECAAFIPEYRVQQEYSLKYLQSTFTKLLNVVDGIQELELMGGEPFLHSEFNPILEWCLQQDKIHAVKIITNGTIIPAEDTWKLMSHKKVKLVVDDYGALSSKYHEIIIHAKKTNVRCEEQSLQTWYSLRPVYDRKYSDIERKSIFCSCNFRSCIGVTNGRLYHCNVAGHMYNAGLILDKKDDYIDLDNPKETGMSFKDRIRNYINIDSMYACSFCNFREGVEVEVAEQV